MALTLREIVLCAILIFVIGVSVLNQTLSPTSISQIVQPSTPHDQTSSSSSSSSNQDKNLRLNNLQIIGTHNSYHREVSLSERAIFPSLMASVDPRVEDYFYSHASVTDQLEHQSVRSLEFDLYVDTKGSLYADPLIRRLANMSESDKLHYALPHRTMQKPGTKVLHIADADVGTICHTLVDCLTEVKTWSRSKKGQHVPIPILLEFKMTETGVIDQGGVRAEEWTVETLDIVDAEIRSVFDDDELITPDQIRKQAQEATGKQDLTLEQAILSSADGGGWPTLSSSRGKVFFVMDNEPTHPIQIREPYRSGGRGNLEGRVIFTNSLPGEPDAAFIKRNDPLTGDNKREIQDLVAKGYFIRSRADEPIQMLLRNETDMREAALASGAHVVSTDWPAVGMSARYSSDYVAKLPGGGTARCNPVNAPTACNDAVLEDLHI
ncbi:uncharacterized protein TRUGW13939_08364 [Talaromyces rugulosus]|uniref:Acid phosphatase n=1 Tax=Talaromyces rugulosus TaxID=121627 RepID=A0A7H8R4V3_TALRU|nr:uncharacterized protein TRUGW13939_08364 [Talaromyces rugulosus]QKX61217.1 hypothetical protein TRUGW13939_08364 [Talaromyces rugulosus]